MQAPLGSIGMTAAIVVGAGLLAGPAHAALLANEQFLPSDHTVGNRLFDNANWSGSNDHMYIADFGLDHVGMLGEAGNAVRGNDGFQNGNVQRAVIGTDTALGVGERWFAALVAINDTTGESASVSLQFDQSSGTIGFGVGDIGSIVGWEVNGGALALDVGETQYVGGTTALIVGRLQVTNPNGAGASEPLTLWFNPTDGADIAALDSTADAKHEITGSSYVNGDWGSIEITAQIQGSGTDTGRIDEIRVGETLSDLNLVPEPASLALMGLGGLLVLGRSKRRA